MHPTNTRLQNRLERALAEYLLVRGRVFEDVVSDRLERFAALEFVREVDRLRSTEAAALLGFSGIMLAADLVLLSADKGSCVFVSGWVRELAFWAGVLLSLCAAVTLLSFSIRFNAEKHGGNPINLLGHYFLHVDKRYASNLFGKMFATIGLMLFLCSLIAQRLWHWTC